MKRRVLMFKPRFGALVVADKKLRTVRPEPKDIKYIPEWGTVLDMRQWSGLAYRSPQVKLCERICSCVQRAKLNLRTRTFYWRMHDPRNRPDAWWEPVEDHLVEAFAKKDGFTDADEMWAWFRAEHGRRRVLKVIVIYWKPGRSVA